MWLLWYPLSFLMQFKGVLFPILFQYFVFRFWWLLKFCYHWCYWTIRSLFWWHDIFVFSCHSCWVVALHGIIIEPILYNQFLVLSHLKALLSSSFSSFLNFLMLCNVIYDWLVGTVLPTCEVSMFPVVPAHKAMRNFNMFFQWVECTKLTLLMLCSFWSHWLVEGYCSCIISVVSSIQYPCPCLNESVVLCRYLLSCFLFYSYRGNIFFQLWRCNLLSVIDCIKQ